MTKNSDERDLRSQFAEILGQEIRDIEEGVVALRERKSVWLEQYDNSYLMSREIGTTGTSTKACSDFPVICIGGLTAIGLHGKVEFLLSQYYCNPASAGGDISYFPTSPIIFVATAQSKDPVIVTTRVYQVPNDVRIEIYTWDPGGAPATDKLVKWICQFPMLRVIN